MSTAASTSAVEALWFIDNLAYVRVDGAQSAGAFALCELLGPHGDMPPLHVHRHDDETFYVIDGQLTLYVGEHQLALSAGQAAVAPRGVPHVYRVESETARWLVINSPAGFERFLRAAAEPAGGEQLPPAGRRPDPAGLAQIAAEHGIEILGPPGTLPSARGVGAAP
jgi:mannose-6-phosphate isomerase-like protein (cupin superfamily)